MPVPPVYWTTQYGNASDALKSGGPAMTFPDVFVALGCVATVPHVEITCLIPPGYGGQLEWTVDVYGRVSEPFR
jgi:hypothetical protein